MEGIAGIRNEEQGWEDPPIGMGITNDSFQYEGNTAIFIERLKNLVTEGAMLNADNLSILPVMPSGPQAFVTSILLNSSVTSSTEQKRSSVQDVRDCVEPFDCCFRDGARVLKQEVKKIVEEVSLF